MRNNNDIYIESFRLILDTYGVIIRNNNHIYCDRPALWRVRWLGRSHTSWYTARGVLRDGSAQCGNVVVVREGREMALCKFNVLFNLLAAPRYSITKGKEQDLRR